MQTIIRYLILCALCGGFCSAYAESVRPKFDFATAERNADIELKRAPAPPTPEGQPPPAKPTVPPCATCKGTGRVICVQHTRAPACVISAQPESEVCKLCKNVGFYACPACKTAPKQELKDKAAEAEAAQAQMLVALQQSAKEIENECAPGRLDTKLTSFCATHFSIGANLPRPLSLLCVQHGESLLPKLDALFHEDTFTFTRAQDTRFFLLDKTVEFKRFLTTIYKERFPDIDIEFSMKMCGASMNRAPCYSCCCYEKMSRIQDSMVHEFVHMYSHILLDRVVGERMYVPWIREGFAAFGETLELNHPAVYCCAYEVNKIDIMKQRVTTLQRMARENKYIPMQKLTQMNYMDMKSDEYFQAWSLITMLIERDPDKFLNFLKILPEAAAGPTGGELKAEEQEKALQQAYGYDFPKLIAVWKQYVIATVR
jgi:hypothetical protein